MNEFGSLIEPPPIPFRFGAPGWYVLAAIILLVLAGACILLAKHYRRNRYRRQALRWLQLREEELQQGDSGATMVYDTNMLLKRIAMRRYGRSTVAGLRGAPYLSLLNQTMRRNLFDQQDEALLTQLLYQPPSMVLPDRAASFAAKSKTWIQQHRYHYAF